MAPQTTSVSSSTWKSLEGKRIFFGHQSVGANILEGIGDLARSSGADALRIVELAGVEPPTPAFVHARVGANGDPGSKLRDFVARLESGVGGWADIAMVKFCYADIGADTDVAKLFEQYQAAAGRLGRKFPSLTIVHVTVPLTTVESGLRARVRRAIGKPMRRVEANRQRERYNDLLRERYGGVEPVFDLARVETGGDPGRAAVRSLSPRFTDDGGHLNGPGRRAAAASLLTLLGQPQP